MAEENVAEAIQPVPPEEKRGGWKRPEKDALKRNYQIKILSYYIKNEEEVYVGSLHVIDQQNPNISFDEVRDERNKGVFHIRKKDIRSPRLVEEKFCSTVFQYLTDRIHGCSSAAKNMSNTLQQEIAWSQSTLRKIQPPVELYCPQLIETLHEGWNEAVPHTYYICGSQEVYLLNVRGHRFGLEKVHHTKPTFDKKPFVYKGVEHKEHPSTDPTRFAVALKNFIELGSDVYNREFILEILFKMILANSYWMRTMKDYLLPVIYSYNVGTGKTLIMKCWKTFLNGRSDPMESRSTNILKDGKYSSVALDEFRIDGKITKANLQDAVHNTFHVNERKLAFPVIGGTNKIPGELKSLGSHILPKITYISVDETQLDLRTVDAEAKIKRLIICSQELSKFKPLLQSIVKTKFENVDEILNDRLQQVKVMHNLNETDARLATDIVLHRFVFEIIIEFLNVENIEVPVSIATAVNSSHSVITKLRSTGPVTTDFFIKFLSIMPTEKFNLIAEYINFPGSDEICVVKSKLYTQGLLMFKGYLESRETRRFSAKVSLVGARISKPPGGELDREWTVLKNKIAEYQRRKETVEEEEDNALEDNANSAIDFQQNPPLQQQPEENSNNGSNFDDQNNNDTGVLNVDSVRTNLASLVTPNSNSSTEKDSVSPKPGTSHGNTYGRPPGYSYDTNTIDDSNIPLDCFGLPTSNNKEAKMKRSEKKKVTSGVETQEEKEEVTKEVDTDRDDELDASEVEEDNIQEEEKDEVEDKDISETAEVEGEKNEATKTSQLPINTGTKRGRKGKGSGKGKEIELRTRITPPPGCSHSDKTSTTILLTEYKLEEKDDLIEMIKEIVETSEIIHDENRVIMKYKTREQAEMAKTGMEDLNAGLILYWYNEETEQKDESENEIETRAKRARKGSK